MRVLFGAVVCILIDSKILTAAQNSTTPDFSPTTPDNFTSTFTPNTSTPVYDICTVLEPPENGSALPDKTTALLKWTTAQTDPNCSPNRIVIFCEALTEENEGWSWIIRNSTANNTFDNANGTTSVYVQDLSEYTNYTCNATLSDGVSFSDPQKIKFQTKEEISDAPDNLTITEATSTNFILQWDKPEKNPGVFIHYMVHIVNKGPNHYIPENCEPHEYDQWMNTTNEWYSFYEAFPDYLYEITVLLQNSAGNGSQASINVTTNTSASQAPTEFDQTQRLNSEQNIIYQNISWNMPCDTNGEIQHFQIWLDGHYIPNYNIVDTRPVIVNVTHSSNRYFAEVEVMPAFLYNITIQGNGFNEEGELFKGSFVTEDNVPGPPIIESVSTGANNVTVIWREPERKAGTITGYLVSIEALRPLYETDPRCPIVSFNKLVETNESSYTFGDLEPYYQYNISVTASTSKGFGDNSTTVANTTTSAPDKPEELTFEYNFDGNLSGQISWKTPCGINGPIKEFIIELKGNYTEDGSLPVSINRSVPYSNGTHNYSNTIPLNESYYYEVKVWIILEDGTDGYPDSKNLTTPDGLPGPPENTNVMNISNQSFTISWDRPIRRNGKIIEYQVNVTSVEPLYETRCPVINKTYNYNLTGNVTTFNEGLPFYTYNISTVARTAAGWGDVSNHTTVNTEPSVPGNVENISINRSLPTLETYNAYVNISFDPPCDINGPFLNYALTLYGKRPNYAKVETTTYSKIPVFLDLPLKAEYTYEIIIKTNNGYYSSLGSSKNFTAPAGIPQLSTPTADLIPDVGTSGGTITLKKYDFDFDNGNIIYLALILSERDETGGDFSTWDFPSWPNTNRDGYNQLTEDWWNPFNESDVVTFTIGNETECNIYRNSCNKPLQSGKDYYLIVRLFTTNFYKNSPTIHFRTEDKSKLGVILGVIFGLLVFALMGFAAFFVWRKRLIKFPPTLLARKSSSIRAPPDGNTSIPIHKFVQYCKQLENNPEKFAEQYMLLTEKSKEIMTTHTTAFAELTENRRKNRYTNILPYDATRVKLLIDEDDEIGSDYINASYIKGYSGNTEYIATQGPLPTTCRDFWKMVIQENVSIIVMVTQFIEDNKEKCFKYFPNNHEIMTIADDMEVKCTMELHFGTYCVRSIQVKKDTTQVTVTHMQYLDWPDFNVPKGTGTMLQFCHQLRERLKIEGGYVIVHCSAGVGRTGTLIATDILIQNINAGKNIDIFNTALELRRQRMMMVQAQKQYVYIHNLIKDTLESHPSELNENLEPLYENQSAMQMKTDDDNLINKGKEKESQF